MATENQQLGTIPENLKELLAQTAKEYQWSPHKVANIEIFLRKQNWNEEQLAHIEKIIDEHQWTPKEIVEIVNAHRARHINADFFVNHPNPKLGKLGTDIHIDITIRCE